MHKHTHTERGLKLSAQLRDIITFLLYCQTIVRENPLLNKGINIYSAAGFFVPGTVLSLLLEERASNSMVKKPTGDKVFSVCLNKLRPGLLLTTLGIASYLQLLLFDFSS